MKGWRWRPVNMKKLKFSQRKALWGFVGVAACILIVFLGILPLVDATRKTQDEILMKKKMILKYDEYLQNRKTVEEELSRTTRQFEEIQQKLLPGETPQLGAGNLQEIVKRLAEKNGIAIRSFKILEPKEINPYRKVSIQIDFNPTSSVLSLGQFMSDLEHHEKELMISEMDLLVLNIRMPNNIQGNMVISGLMRGTKESPKPKGKGREG